MSISKRLWDVARANVSDFAQAFVRREDDFGLTPEERAKLDEEIKAETAGARVGRSARKVADAAEDAWDRAYRAAQERARQTGAQVGQAMSAREQREQWLRTLELNVDADYASVRKSYRRLVAKYHPDRHSGDPERYKAATEVSRKITEAYDGLRDHFERSGQT